MAEEPYHADPSLRGKLRRRLVRLRHRRPAPVAPAGPMISFSFDDAPLSAFRAGAEVLERHGLHASFFVCAGLAGQDSFVGPLGGREEMGRAVANGHEIACHSASHLDCGRADGRAVSADLYRNSELLLEWGLPPPETFAYPYGDVGPAAKRVVGARFGLARSVRPGLITRGCDLAQAPAVGVEGPDGETHALEWMERARRASAWLILFTHDVAEEPTRYGCTPGALDRLAAAAARSGFTSVTVAQGARRLHAPS